MNVEQALVSFAFAAGLLTITPGLDTALVLRTAAVEGRKPAMLAGLGICFGCLAWGVGASLGLSALLAVSRFAYNALRIVGACYLCYLGITFFIRAFSAPFPDGATESGRKGQVSTDGFQWLRRGLLTNLLNPKVGIFYLSFLPQFIPAGVQVSSFSMLRASIHATEGILWFLLITNATEFFSSWLRRLGVVMALDGALGAILIAFGFKLAFDKAR
jgi:threonine/homoserine/homoserine lactone efflux protein